MGVEKGGGDNKLRIRFSKVQMKSNTIKLLRLSFDWRASFRLQEPAGFMSFDFCLLQLCRTIQILLAPCWRESASGLYPILLAGARLDPNISLQREMVQECVKRQGAQVRETEGGKRGWWGGLEPCETGMMQENA